jgi:lipopolysaccharide transport system ATP-binding protein
MSAAIRIENLGKCYRLGETHEHTLSDQIVRLARRVTGRKSRNNIAPEDFWALRDVSLEIQEGEAVGIIGGNGAGKSTLLKILSRITQPTTGRALVRGRLSSLLEVGTGFHPELTGRENVFLNGTILGMRHTEVARKFDEIVAFSGVEQFIDTPVKRYSSGMYVRLAFAVAAHLEPDVLVIDEVLAVGDAEFQKRCLGKMGDVAREGRTVLFVSHNMAAVQKLCSRAVLLKGGNIEANGNARDVVAAYLETISIASGSTGEDRAEGCLYRNGDATKSRARIQALYIRDARGSPKICVNTEQFVKFQVLFEVTEYFRSFAVEIKISTKDGSRVIWTATAPSRGMYFSVEPGGYSIDCDFERLPLSAGEYNVGLALAIPNAEYLWQDEELTTLVVGEEDIYNTGCPPRAMHYLIATPHEWRNLRTY